MWWLITFSTVGGLLVLVLLGRRNEKAVRRDWELLLTPRGEKLYKSISGRVQSQLELADMTYDEAFSVRQLGSVEEAKHLLDVGFTVIEKFSPTMMQLLSAMATFSRMVSAMTPVKPLRPQSFQLPQIVSLAYLNQVVHQFLVSTGERFRLRLYVLGRGFGLASRFLLASTRRITTGAPACTTTITRGCRAATASTRASCAGGRSRLVRSRPSTSSRSGRPTKTSAASAPSAATRAWAISACSTSDPASRRYPSAYRTRSGPSVATSAS